MTLQIPSRIFQNAPLESTCVEYWWDSKLENRVNSILPVGWKFKSHVIKERDSFGPVTSLLKLTYKGRTFEHLI